MGGKRFFVICALKFSGLSGINFLLQIELLFFLGGLEYEFKAFN